ncbi:hypothetical protein NFX46_17145 [Streptomyces phaeoluteigriseus]|uniref:Peptidoglycan binding-like domain-containing protein n=1 Tax=Streptomyces phaeoluteigriseus TaxID=114686 RepID=A0ABY4ZMK8_9ACTN|nr:hypothetical protein NFX46_17145 [Streptomyces phaeoluteigriseus]
MRAGGGADGLCGTGTVDAVRWLQTNRLGVSAAGVYGPATVGDVVAGLLARPDDGSGPLLWSAATTRRSSPTTTPVDADLRAGSRRRPRPTPGSSRDGGPGRPPPAPAPAGRARLG